MGRWTYYSPFFIAASWRAAAVDLRDSCRRSPGSFGLLLLVACGAGLACSF